MCTDTTEPSWRGAKSDSKPFFLRTRTSKQDVYAHKIEQVYLWYRFICLRVQRRLRLCETPWLCHINKVDIQSSNPPVSVVQVLMYSWHVVEYRACFSRHISALSSSCSWYILLLSYDQHTCWWFWICVVTTCLLIVDIAERGNPTTTWALAKSQDNWLERLHEGVQYPIRGPLLSVWVVLVSRLNTDTDHTWILRICCCRSMPPTCIKAGSSIQPQNPSESNVQTVFWE